MKNIKILIKMPNIEPKYYTWCAANGAGNFTSAEQKSSYAQRFPTVAPQLKLDACGYATKFGGDNATPTNFTGIESCTSNLMALGHNKFNAQQMCNSWDNAYNRFDYGTNRRAGLSTKLDIAVNTT